MPSVWHVSSLVVQLLWLGVISAVVFAAILQALVVKNSESSMIGSFLERSKGVDLVLSRVLCA